MIVEQNPARGYIFYACTCLTGALYSSIFVIPFNDAISLGWTGYKLILTSPMLRAGSVYPLSRLIVT